MPTYRRRTRVAAPLEEVWAFHSDVSGLEALTPNWMGLRVDGIDRPHGAPDPETLEVGTRIRLSMRPLGVGPRLSWVSKITERRRDGESAMFRDVMEDGPFRRWDHSHLFFGDGTETVVVDELEYALPGGALGDLAGPFARVGFEGMFRQRHRRTRELLSER